MKICIFPGTFNPIHKAHLRIAEYVLENFLFDKILFIPAYIPPHKNIDKNMAIHRLNMVKLAISYNKKFEISDIEYKNEGKSYSLLTVQSIINQYNLKNKVDFIIGTDAFKQIKTWYHSDELAKLVHFIVFPRENDTINKNEFLDYDYEIVDMPPISISSTDIRHNIHRKDVCEEVKEYINSNDLYR